MTDASINNMLDAAFEIFYEMAEDNLEFSDLTIYHASFEENGAGIALEPANDWASYVDFELDANQFIEIQIGIAGEDNELEDVLARMLLNRDPDEKFCHILWKRTNH